MWFNKITGCGDESVAIDDEFDSFAYTQVSEDGGSNV